MTESEVDEDEMDVWEETDDVEDDEMLDDTVSGSGVRAEIPPRYDMIRRDTQESQVGRQNANADASPASRPRSADIGSAL